MARPLLTTFNFDVQIEVEGASGYGLPKVLCNAAFAECDGLEMTMEPKMVREGGNNTRQIPLVGQVSYGMLTLRRGMTEDLDLWKWFTVSSSNRGRGTKGRGIITVQNGARESVLKYSLNGCLPVKIKAPSLNARSGLLAIEEMQIAYSFFTIEKAG